MHESSTVSTGQRVPWAAGGSCPVREWFWFRPCAVLALPADVGICRWGSCFPLLLEVLLIFGAEVAACDSL